MAHDRDLAEELTAAMLPLLEDALMVRRTVLSYAVQLPRLVQSQQQSPSLSKQLSLSPALTALLQPLLHPLQRPPSQSAV